MAEKARLFKDRETLKKILEESSPEKIKALGRQVSNFDEKVWKSNCFRIVVEGNCAKFSQEKSLQDWLLSTGEQVLVEASPYDKIWGIGLKEEDANAKNPARWNGQNLLGFALMTVRDTLRAQQKS